MNLKKIINQFFTKVKAYSLYDKVVFSLAIAVSLAMLVYHGLYHTGIIKLSASKPVACDQSGSHNIHVVEITNNGFNPAQVQAKVCDSLKFISRDETLHEPALGAHPNHIEYPGYEEKGLQNNDSNEFVLSLPGEFSMHDHLNEKIEGKINVSK